MQHFCVAQQLASKRVTVGVSYTMMVVKDEAMSALEYRGNYYGMVADYAFGGKGPEQNLRLGFGEGRLHNMDYGTSLTGKSFHFSYSILPVVYWGKSLRLLAGGVSDNDLALRKQDQFINNNQYYEFTGSLALTVKVDYRAAGYSIQSALSSPALSALSKSASLYNSVSDVQSPTFNSYLKNLDLVSFNRYHKFSWNSEISRRFFKNSGFTLSYLWDYYRITEQNQVRSISHMAAIKYFWSL